MPIRAVLWVLFVALACRPTTTTTPRTDAPRAAAMSVIDEHSHARQAHVTVRHFGLDLAVDFATRTLSGTATLAVQRHDAREPLRLDASALDISRIEVARSPTSFEIGKT